MKRLLLVTVLLAMVVPAGAEVLIYNLKEKNVESEYYSTGWERSTRNCKGYVVVEIDGDIAEAVFIETWTGKIDDVTARLMDDSKEYEFEVRTIQTDDKKFMILSCGDEEYRLLLTGEIKPANIGNDEPKDIARKLVGGFIFYDGFYACSTQISISLNTNLTIEANERLDNMYDAADRIIEALENKNYEYP
jgi:hypothetical protein